MIAPNAFKGTLTAAQAGRAAAAALKKIIPGAGIEVLPIADGGDGLLDALAGVMGGGVIKSRVEGPLGGLVHARWLMSGRTAVIEMAEAAGLGGVRPHALRPLAATTRGVGELMRAAVEKGAREIIVGLGGSASSDGGAGCAAAFGFSLLDARGRPIGPGVSGLAALAAILPGTGAARLERIRVTGLADVRNPLCGRFGSARVFGPQKGAGRNEVVFIGKALANYARVVRKCLGLKISTLRGGAAAGGLGAGLAAFFGAELADGAAFVLEKTGFEARLKAADLLITGEGCFDRQTFYGKAPGAALSAARRLGVPAIVVCGMSRIGNRRELTRRGVIGVIASGPSRRPAAALRRALARGLPPLLREFQRGKRLPAY